MTSFRATFGLTRSIGDWEEGERRERNNRRGSQDKPAQDKELRQWQLNEQCEEISIDVEEREEIFVHFLRMRKSESGDRTYGGSAWPSGLSE